MEIYYFYIKLPLTHKFCILQEKPLSIFDQLQGIRKETNVKYHGFSISKERKKKNVKIVELSHQAKWKQKAWLKAEFSWSKFFNSNF